jgi:hypothetical protein
MEKFWHYTFDNELRADPAEHSRKKPRLNREKMILETIEHIGRHKLEEYRNQLLRATGRFAARMHFGCHFSRMGGFWEKGRGNSGKAMKKLKWNKKKRKRKTGTKIPEIGGENCRDEFVGIEFFRDVRANFLNPARSFGGKNGAKRWAKGSDQRGDGQMKRDEIIFVIISLQICGDTPAYDRSLTYGNR